MYIYLYNEHQNHILYCVDLLTNNFEKLLLFTENKTIPNYCLNLND